VSIEAWESSVGMDSRDCLAEEYYRDAKVGETYEGRSSIQLMMIAKQVLWKQWSVVFPQERIAAPAEIQSSSHTYS
jgi:hypothetical protein